MTYRILFTFSTLLWINFCIAQNGNRNLPPSYFFGEESSNIPIVTTPRVNHNQLTAEDRVNDQLNQPKRFAVGFTTNYNLENSGRWDDLPDGGRIWRLAIRCPNALSINLLYNEFHLPEGVEYYVYQSDYSQILGRFTNANTRPSGKFATALINKSLLVVELYEPLKLVGQSRLEIGQVNRGYRSLESINTNGGGSGDCQVDVNCSPEGDNWQIEKKSVARYLIEGTKVCTGTLVNNTAEDGRQLFLTAYHCVDELDAVTNPDASDFVFYWNFARDECGTNGSSQTATTSGATLLANHTNSDFALFELHENPRAVADVYYAGWDATSNIPSGGVSIHHPGGDFKKIATHSLVPTWDNWLGTSPASSHLKVLPWDGTPNGHSVTQKGSSGAPLFNNQHHLIGQLHGGSNIDCNAPASDPGIFGALNYSWNNNNASSPQRRLSDWLDPINGGNTRVLNGKSVFPPMITFTTNQLEVIEELTTAGKDCATYATYNLRMEIADAPTEAANITLVTNGTATKGFDADFVIQPETFQFTPTKRFQDITLRVYNDAIIEDIETISISYQLDAQNGNASTGVVNQQINVAIESKDVDPTATKVTDITFWEDFENGLGSFTTTTSGNVGFATGDVSTASSDYWKIVPTKNATEFAFVNDDVCNCMLNDVLLISPNFDFSNTVDAILVFDYAFSGQDYEKLEILVSTDDGQNWSTPIATMEYESNYLSNGIYETDWVENEVIDLKNYDNLASLRFAFRYSDGNIWAYGTAIDNVRLLTTTQQSSTPVQMAVNSNDPTYARVPPFTTVHFYDPSSKNIIATVENDSDHDFGCTTLEVDRAGASATYPFANSENRQEIFSKTFKFTPEFQSTTADYILTTYHQPEEITAWQNVAVQNDNDSLKAIQVTDNQLIKNINSNNITFYNINQQTAQVSNFGTDIKISSFHFGGLSAFGFGMQQQIPNTTVLPLELLYFSGKTQTTGNFINWATASEIDLTAFQLERSTDGINFSTIATLPAAQIAYEYDFLDAKIQANQTYFYRLKSVETGTEKVVSPVIQVQTQNQVNNLQISPNPFSNQLQIQTDQDEIIDIYDAFGRIVERINTNDQNVLELNTNRWKSGVYFIKTTQTTLRVIKL
ncbi:MAG: T9SS type A sorting domain-containing protein [Saprospiraceae bacterium]